MKKDDIGVWRPENEHEKVDIKDFFESTLDTPLFNFERGQVLLNFEYAEVFVKIKEENHINNVGIMWVRENEPTLYLLYMRFSDLRIEVKNGRVSLYEFWNEIRKIEDE